MGIRSSVGILAAPYSPLYKRISLLSLLLYLRDTHFFFRFPIIIVIASYKPSDPILNFFDFLLKNRALGIPNATAIFQTGANKSPICCLFYILRTLIKISSQETRSRGYKTFFMLSSAEYEIFSVNKYENAYNSCHFHIY